MEEKIIGIIKEDFEKEGFEIVELKLSRQRGRTVVRVFIDKPGGVTLGDCEKASGIAGFLIDGSGINIADYEIEVSSPGLGRPLKTEKDFVKNTGKTVMINLTGPLGDIKGYIEGKIDSVKDGVVILDCNSGRKSVPIDKIANAKIRIEI